MSSSRPRKRKSSTRKRSSSTRRRSSSSKKNTSRTTRMALLAVVLTVGLAVAGYAGYDYFEGFVEDPAEAGNGGDIRHGDLDRAREQLAELEVAEHASMSGYSRDRFDHWQRVDGGCNVRHKVLDRDGENIEFDGDSCTVVDGTWFSAFDGVTLDAPGDVDIDHMVPLANSWRTGAADWDDDRRAAFANDMETPQLIAVSASSNRAKGDQDPSQWKPSERGFWCQYAHDWVIVKHYWELWVTAAEKDALSDMLDTCR